MMMGTFFTEGDCLGENTPRRDPFTSIIRRIKTLGNTSPCDTRSLISAPNDEFTSPEHLITTANALFRDIEGLRQAIRPLREQLEGIEGEALEDAHRYYVEVDLDGEHRLRELEILRFDLTAELREYKRELAHAQAQFTKPHKIALEASIASAEAKQRDLELDIFDLTPIIQTKSQKLFQVLNSELAEDIEENEVEIERLTAVLNQLKAEEMELNDDYGFVHVALEAHADRYQARDDYTKKLSNVRVTKLRRRTEMKKFKARREADLVAIGSARSARRQSQQEVASRENFRKTVVRRQSEAPLAEPVGAVPKNPRHNQLFRITQLPGNVVITVQEDGNVGKAISQEDEDQNVDAVEDVNIFTSVVSISRQGTDVA
jgi:hypothetical protein